MAAPNAKRTSQKSTETVEDDFVETYGDLLNELRLLTTVSVLLFGFLLTIRATEIEGTERWLYFASIVSVATATALFALPVVYHRLEFPYRNWERFERRTHAFIMAGIPFLVLGFYLSLAVSLWDSVEGASFVVAAIPIMTVLIVLASRRFISPSK